MNKSELIKKLEDIEWKIFLYRETLLLLKYSDLLDWRKV